MPCRCRPIRSHISPWCSMTCSAWGMPQPTCSSGCRTRTSASGRTTTGLDGSAFRGKVPFEYASTVEAGGNAANAAVGLSRLGVRTAIAAHVGSDDIGRTMQAALERDGWTPSGALRTQAAEQPELRALVRRGHDPGPPRARPRPLATSAPGAPRWDRPELGRVRRGVVLRRARRLARRRAFGALRPSSPDMFQIAQGVAAMRGLYRRADVLNRNREEAVEIGGGDHGSLPEILDSLHRLGPSTVVVTDGPGGAAAVGGSPVVSRSRSYPQSFPAEGAHGRGGRVLLRPRGCARQGTPARDRVGPRPGERDERGAGGRLADGPPR